jgi:hypothetical protein
LIIGPRRVALIGAIAAVVLTIVFYPLLVQTPFDLEDINIQLIRVMLASGSQEEQELDLRISLNITNMSEYTLTTSKIEYELFADGAPVGTDTISYEDIPVNGRPALFSNAPPITITDTFTLDYSDDRAELFNQILGESTDISWSITGSASIESGTSFQEKTFTSEL